MIISSFHFISSVHIWLISYIIHRVILIWRACKEQINYSSSVVAARKVFSHWILKTIDFVTIVLALFGGLGCKPIALGSYGSCYTKNSERVKQRFWFFLLFSVSRNAELGYILQDITRSFVPLRSFLATKTRQKRFFFWRSRNELGNECRWQKYLT